jgi:hypothetical protein
MLFLFCRAGGGKESEKKFRNEKERINRRLCVNA